MTALQADVFQQVTEEATEKGVKIIVLPSE